MGAVTSGCVSVFVTCAARDEAEHMARTLVTEGLAACVNILPGATSVYRWKGETHADPELVLFMKTREDQAQRLCARVEELHSYDVPCIVVLPLAGGSSRYLGWIREQTGG